MTSALAKLRTDVTRDHVLRALDEYDRLGQSGSSLRMDSDPVGVMNLSGTNAVTRTRRSWEQRMSSPRASALAPAISRVERAAPWRC